jgi:ornithine carbamoyltransferase
MPPPTPPQGVPHFLSLADTTPNGLARLTRLATELKELPHSRRDALAGHAVLLLFDKPSSRTRFSFEAAVARLGGSVVFSGPGDGVLGAREPIRDLARVVSRFFAAVVVRTHDHAAVEELARWSSIPVVNGLTDRHHPCQALADVLTLTECFGGVTGLDAAYVGDGASNVATSLIQAFAISGGWLRLGCPPDHRPDGAVLDEAQREAEDAGGQILVVDDPGEAVDGVQAVYTDVFVSMGEEAERERKLAALSPYRVDADLMARARPDAVFMHCLPAHRGEEVTDEVLEGRQSVVFDQAENRLPTAAAVLVALTAGRLTLPEEDV